MISAIGAFLDALPGWVYALIIAGILVVSGGTIGHLTLANSALKDQVAALKKEKADLDAQIVVLKQEKANLTAAVSVQNNALQEAAAQTTALLAKVDVLVKQAQAQAKAKQARIDQLQAQILASKETQCAPAIVEIRGMLQ